MEPLTEIFKAGVLAGAMAQGGDFSNKEEFVTAYMPSKGHTVVAVDPSTNSAYALSCQNHEGLLGESCDLHVLHDGKYQRFFENIRPKNGYLETSLALKETKLLDSDKYQELFNVAAESAKIQASENSLLHDYAQNHNLPLDSSFSVDVDGYRNKTSTLSCLPLNNVTGLCVGDFYDGPDASGHDNSNFHAKKIEIVRVKDADTELRRSGVYLPDREDNGQLKPMTDEQQEAFESLKKMGPGTYSSVTM